MEVPEGRNMSTIKDEEELYQNLKNLSIVKIYIDSGMFLHILL